MKTVEFELKGAATISNLKVLDVYTSNTTTPTWAIENTGWAIADIDPLWGMISPQLASHRGISTFRKPELYLPAGASLFPTYQGSIKDAVAGITGPIAALNAIYSGTLIDNGDALAGHPLARPDYSGTMSWSLLLEWSRLGRNASTAGRVIDLIWTDLMANLLVGTRSLESTTQTASVTRSVSEYQSVVAYNWNYAIMALLFASLYLLLLVASVLSYVFGRCNISMLRFFLNQTAAGRSVTTERFQAKCPADTGTNKEWSSARGDELVLVGKDDAQEPSHHSRGLISASD